MNTSSPKTIVVGNVCLSNKLPFVLVAGPCQIESYDHAMMMAENLNRIAQRAKIDFIYKSSFDKANRSSINSQRGIGIDDGLKILGNIRNEFGCPVLTDVHEVDQCDIVAKEVDVLQIPAFLCRQTNLLLAAARTGKVINVKKGQFLAPWDMKNIVDKIESVDNQNIVLCDRGTSFGYNTLVSDFRSIPIMAETGYPIMFDATHSVQQPGGRGTTSGGQREFVVPLAKASAAIGVSSIFIETHQDPDNAPSDGPNMIPLNQMEKFLKDIRAIDTLTKGT